MAEKHSCAYVYGCFLLSKIVYTSKLYLLAPFWHHFPLFHCCKVSKRASRFLGKPHKRTSKMLRISSVAGIRQMPAKSIKQGLSSKLEVPVIIAFYALISLLSRKLLNNRSNPTRTYCPTTLTD